MYSAQLRPSTAVDGITQKPSPNHLAQAGLEFPILLPQLPKY